MTSFAVLNSLFVPPKCRSTQSFNLQQSTTSTFYVKFDSCLIQLITFFKYKAPNTDKTAKVLAQM